MLILSHRGYWLTPQEKNTPRAFARSFHLGFGTELDLRDLAGRLVVSHDPPGANALPAEVLFGIHDGIDPQLPLALNIKADGVQQLLLPIVGDGTLRNVFLFDMSVPDAVQWLRTPLPVFTRHSDVEREPAFYDQAAGVWLDGFRSDWWDASVIARHVDAGKKVCIVSPELHGREHRKVWERLAAGGFGAESRVMLCTDHPVEARGAFDG